MSSVLPSLLLLSHSDKDSYSWLLSTFKQIKLKQTNTHTQAVVFSSLLFINSLERGFYYHYSYSLGWLRHIQRVSHTWKSFKLPKKTLVITAFLHPAKSSLNFLSCKSGLSGPQMNQPETHIIISRRLYNTWLAVLLIFSLKNTELFFFFLAKLATKTSFTITPDLIIYNTSF